MTPSLVIFDCDGVLVDTERLANEILAKLITELGFPISGPDCQKRFMGRTLESVKEMVEELTNCHLSDDWPNHVRKLDLEAFEKGVDAIPGVEQVLDELDKRHVPYCVGSSGEYRKMRTTLGSCGLLPRMEGKLFSAQDCERGKPAPDVFLLAAKKMGHEPVNCVVIEDSVPGVTAARAAGMRAFAFVDDPACDHDAMNAAGGVLFKSMSELPDLLFSNT